MPRPVGPKLMPPAISAMCSHPMMSSCRPFHAQVAVCPIPPFGSHPACAYDGGQGAYALHRARRLPRRKAGNHRMNLPSSPPGRPVRQSHEVFRQKGLPCPRAPWERTPQRAVPLQDGEGHLVGVEPAVVEGDGAQPFSRCVPDEVCQRYELEDLRELLGVHLEHAGRHEHGGLIIPPAGRPCPVVREMAFRPSGSGT